MHGGENVEFGKFYFGYLSVWTELWRKLSLIHKIQYIGAKNVKVGFETPKHKANPTVLVFYWFHVSHSEKNKGVWSVSWWMVCLLIILSSVFYDHFIFHLFYAFGIKNITLYIYLLKMKKSTMEAFTDQNALKNQIK